MVGIPSGDGKIPPVEVDLSNVVIPNWGPIAWGLWGIWMGIGVSLIVVGVGVKLWKDAKSKEETKLKENQNNTEAPTTSILEPTSEISKKEETKNTLTSTNSFTTDNAPISADADSPSD